MTDSRSSASEHTNYDSTPTLQDPATTFSQPHSPSSRPIIVNTQPTNRTHGAITANYDPKTKLATGVTMEDYRRLNAKSTERGMYTGVLAGGGITYVLKRFTPISKNALTLTFLLSATTISYLTSLTLLNTSLESIVSKAKISSLPQAEGSENAGPVFQDSARIFRDHDNDNDNSLNPIPKTPQQELKEELNRLGLDRNRTRWSKGRGLVGEVEEESEMRDTFFRPGMPRSGV